MRQKSGSAALRNSFSHQKAEVPTQLHLTDTGNFAKSRVKVHEGGEYFYLLRHDPSAYVVVSN